MIAEESIGQTLVEKQSTLDALPVEGEQANYKLSSLLFLSTRRGALIGLQATYQHVMERHKTYVSSLIRGSAAVEEHVKDVISFEEGEYVIQIAGTYDHSVTRIFILTSEGRYLEIGAKAKGTGQEFEWNFMKDRYFHALKVGVEEFVVYLSPVAIVIDPIRLKPKERIPKKIDISTDIITPPNLIYKSKPFGDESVDSLFFDDLIESKFQIAIAQNAFFVQSLDCIIYQGTIIGMSITYNCLKEIKTVLHQIKITPEMTLKKETKTLKIGEGDYIFKISCAFNTNLKYLQMETKKGNTLIVGAARDSEVKFILPDLQYREKAFAFFGSITDRGIGTLGVYYEKELKTSEADAFSSVDKKSSL